MVQSEAVVGIFRKNEAYLIEGPRKFAALIGQDTEQVQAVEVVGLHRENILIDPFSLSPLTGLMLREGLDQPGRYGDRRRLRRHRSFRHIFLHETFPLTCIQAAKAPTEPRFTSGRYFDGGAPGRPRF